MEYVFIWQMLKFPNLTFKDSLLCSIITKMLLSFQTANHSIQPQVEKTLTKYIWMYLQIKKCHYQIKSKQA